MAAQSNFKNQIELCLLTFIPTKEAIEPDILAGKSFLRLDPSKPLILYDRDSEK